jgi:hypothetical protein
MSGTAVLGTDYTLSGTPGKITISAGASSAVVTLQVITSKTKGSETATMNLQAGTGYTVNQKQKSASVKIVN